MMLCFIVLQSVLLLFMVFHDWISIPPLNDIKTLKSSDSFFYRILGSTINGTTVLIPLVITLLFYHQPSFSFNAAITVFSFYLLLTVGLILSWWIPYLCGSSQKHKQQFSKFKNTHHFLPARGDNVIPNTLHIMLHFQILSCLAISIYFLMGRQ